MVEEKKKGEKSNQEKFVIQDEILGKNFKKKSFGKKIFSLIKGFFKVILGFLPSFLFVLLFLQYGSPISNYISFLTKIESSWVAWLSAVIIVSLISFIGRINQIRKDPEKRKKKKTLLIILFFSFFFLFLLIGAQSYLYVNYLLKNDVLVRLSVDKENIFFTDNPSEKISFYISVTSNPFCSSFCKYNFVDLSSDKEIGSGSFTLSSIYPITKSYDLTNEGLSQGSQTLRRFEVSCKSEKTFLCHTNEDWSKRSVLITVNYNLSLNDLNLKEKLKMELIYLWEKLYLTRLNLEITEKNLFLINSSFEKEELSNKTNEIYPQISQYSSWFFNLESLWENQSFNSLNEQMPFFIGQISQIKNDSENIKSLVLSNISEYNFLVNSINQIKEEILNFSNQNLDPLSCGNLNKLADIFNDSLASFLDSKSLKTKSEVVFNLSTQKNLLYLNISPTSEETSSCLLLHPVTELNLSNISNFSKNPNPPSLDLKEKQPLCCFLGECLTCLGDEYSQENYPIIFLHGHSINKKLPADYSLDVFNEIKQELALGRYIDAGAIILTNSSTDGGLWGKMSVPILITASYFFDTSKTEKGEITIGSTTESIDTYAIRLKSIVELVKYKTAKDKVILVAHSMGGLVTRRYIQLFGLESVDKIILITVPNHGTADKIKEYCGIIGSEKTCKEMEANSLFINNLNNNPSSYVETHNLVGIGCNMGDETGDGVLKNSSQHLTNASNYYFEGKCNELSFNFFHETIMYPELYPEVYNKIKDILA